MAEWRKQFKSSGADPVTAAGRARRSASGSSSEAKARCVECCQFVVVFTGRSLSIDARRSKLGMPWCRWTERRHRRDGVRKDQVTPEHRVPTY